jgi:uncharacterized damage-inducible protein DinB
MSLSPSALSRLEFQHQTIRELIANIPEEALRRRSQPDKWSVFENIAHLAAYQSMFLQRLRRMQEEDSPGFNRYVAEQDPLFPLTLEKTLTQILTDIDEKRNILLAKLKGMDETALERTGSHPKHGRFSIIVWTEFFLLHEAHHLYTIFALVRDLHKSF